MVEPDPSTLNGFASVMREKLVDVPREIVVVADPSASRIMSLILLFTSGEEKSCIVADEMPRILNSGWSSRVVEPDPIAVMVAVDAESLARRIVSVMMLPFSSAEEKT